MFDAGTRVNVIKLRPDGIEATRYRAIVHDEPIPEPWVVVQAEWVFKRVESHGLVFEPGDRLFEYFSPEHGYDAFRVEAPDGTFRGWYGNVTWPTTITGGTEPTIVWHDLYLDVIRLADGTVKLCDEDELEQSGLRVQDPTLYETIQRTAAVIMNLAQTGEFPFHIPGKASE